MKPNVFAFAAGDCSEDFFSKSLAYVANRIPGIGAKLIRRIAVLAGRRPDHFGAFDHCDFAAHERPDGHPSSRPDLKVVCSKGVIYLENKLDSPLSLRQMERHARFTRRTASSLVFASNILHRRPELKALSGYLHPKGRDHYLWLDFLPALEDGDHRAGRLAATILSDFRSALKADGMVGRQINGAHGSLYTPHSDAVQLALGQLSEVLKTIGFKVVRGSEDEDTLRVYPVNYPQYPLLNPRFSGSAAWIDEAWDRECLEVTVVSRGAKDCIDRQLRRFRPTANCAFKPHSGEDYGYNYHGWFLLPVRFTGSGVRSEIDYGALRKPLSEILRCLAV